MIRSNPTNNTIKTVLQPIVLTTPFNNIVSEGFELPNLKIYHLLIKTLPQFPKSVSSLKSH